MRLLGYFLALSWQEIDLIVEKIDGYSHANAIRAAEDTCEVRQDHKITSCTWGSQIALFLINSVDEGCSKW